MRIYAIIGYAAAALCAASGVYGQAFPSKPLRIVVPFAAGGPADITSRYGLLLPAKTPREVVMKLHDAAVKTVNTPAVRERLISVGADPLTMSPDEFTEFIRKDIEKWAALARAANIVIER